MFQDPYTNGSTFQQTYI